MNCGIGNRSGGTGTDGIKIAGTEAGTASDEAWSGIGAVGTMESRRGTSGGTETDKTRIDGTRTGTGTGGQKHGERNL